MMLLQVFAFKVFNFGVIPKYMILRQKNNEKIYIFEEWL